MMPINQHPSLHTNLLGKSGGGGVGKTTWEFSGSPVVRTVFSLWRARAQSQVKKLKFHMLFIGAKKKKKKS